jgi:hypothetical protein
MRRALLVCVLSAAIPSVAVAQPPPSGGNVPPSIPGLVVTPNNFPHPTQPWNGSTRPDTRGPTVAYIAVPAQQVTVLQPAPGAEGEPARWEHRLVTVPGYVITQTTLGYEYPERWTLEQTGPGVYQWRLLPAEFRRR